jgi:hypothetical protein|nr:hypothetical protein [uncultured Limnohabitans sp.]
MHDAHIFLENLLAANPACELFFNTIELMDKELRRLGLLSS